MTASTPETAGPRTGDFFPRLMALITRYVPAGLLYFLLVVLVILPVGVLIYAAVVDVVPRPGAESGNLTLQNLASLFNRSSRNAAANSLILGVGGTAMAVTLGGILAWLSARTDVPFRPMVQIAGVVPLFMSPLVGALAWSTIASPGRSYASLFMEQIGINWSPNINSLGGMIFVFGLYYAPYAFLLLNGPLTLMNPELEEAAETHGASRLQTIRHVTFPLVVPAFIGSVLLTMVLVIENFAVPTILGSPAGIDTLPGFIYRLMSSSPPRANQAAAVGLLLMGIMTLLVYVQRRYISRKEYTTISGKGMTPKKTPLGKWRWPAAGLVAFYLVLAVVVPLFALLQMSLRPHAFVTSFWELFDPSIFTMRNVDAAFGHPSFWLGFRNSIIVGILTAVVGGLLHLVMAYTVLRSRMPGRRFVEYVAMVPLALPALVLGMGFLWTWINLPIPIYGTIWVLVAAYVVRFMPQGFQGMSSSMLQLHPDIEDSALLSGASRIRTVREITLPLIRSGAAGTLLILLILGMRELTTALFLFTSRTRVLSIVIFDFWDNGMLANAAVASLAYSVLLMAVVLVARRWLEARGTAKAPRADPGELPSTTVAPQR